MYYVAKCRYLKINYKEDRKFNNQISEENKKYFIEELLPIIVK